MVTHCVCYKTQNENERIKSKDNIYYIFITSVKSLIALNHILRWKWWDWMYLVIFENVFDTVAIYLDISF